MKFSTILVFTTCWVADSTEVTPVQKVVQLMEGMMEKGKQEKHDEQVQFATYKTFCETTSADKQKAIADANDRIELLQADIEKYMATAARLEKEIAVHDADIATWKGDKTAATKVRAIEEEDYNALHKDYSESIDALQRAIKVLKDQAHDRAQASFVQVSALQNMELIPKEARRAIAAFLQAPSDDEGLEVSAPEAKGYEFQSSGVVNLCEKLLDKFITKRTDIEKAEMTSKQEYEMLMQDLKHQLADATEDRDTKDKRKSKTLQAKADAEGDLTDTTTTRDADTTYLNDLVAECEQKATDFESRQELRAEELVAVQKAIDIISSGAVSGNADKHLPSLAQTKASALAQIMSDARLTDQAKAARFLKEQARQYNSRVLAQVAQHMDSDPFQKVKKMIKDLIVRLIEEAQDEVEHKGWCDTELQTNQQTRVQKTQAVERLHAEIDQLEASIAKLSEDLEEFTAAVAELDGAMAKATKIREEEHAENTVTISDSKDAQTAVAQALTVLNEFYAKAGEATALLQQQPEAPEIFDKPYRGMGGESGGVIGMLEVIQSDFARLEADTKGAEAAAQKEYEKFMEDSKMDHAAKSMAIKHKTAKRQDQEEALVQKKGDVEGTQKELDAALQYFDKLKPSCLDATESYDDRVQRREEEIQSLKDALRILNGEDIA